MAEVPQLIAARVIFYAQTLAQWTSSNPIIPQAETVKEIGIGSPVIVLSKTGNGVDHYLDLPYDFTGGSGGSGNLQNVLNAGNTANTVGGNVADIKLISPVPTQSVEITGGAVGFLDTGSGDSANFEIDNVTITNASGTGVFLSNQLSIASSSLLSTLTSALLYLKNASNQIVAQIANVSNGGELWLKTAASNVLSKIKAVSTSAEMFLLPDKGGAGGTFAMLSDITAPHPTGTPTWTYGAAAGSSPGASIVNGDDRCGFVTFTTGTLPLGSGTIGTLSFHTSYGASVTVFWTPQYSGVNPVLGIQPQNQQIIGGGVSVPLNSGGALAANTTYIFNYFIVPVL